MSKLTEFYTMKSHLFTEGQGDETKWNEFEDKLIREELLPEIMSLIKPTLSQVKSPLYINISYYPSGNLAVTATRNCIQASLPIESAGTPTEEVPGEPSFVSEPSIEEGQQEEGQPEESDPVDTYESTEPLRKKKKSVGIIVKFKDGTVIHEKKAVHTWLNALRKIGLDVICNNSRRHEAWHNVDGKDVCIVERVQTFREDTGESPQSQVDGYYVMTQLSNSQKIKDLNALSRFLPKLGIKVEWVNENGDFADEETFTKEVVNNISHQYDRTKYIFNGSEPLNKRRLALALVRKYVEDHPDVDYEELKRVFRPEIISGRGVVRSITDLDDISQEEQPKRYLMKDSELIYLPLSDDIITVCTQWNPDRIATMVKIARTLGYEVKEVE